jgi:hypothetical protein
MAALDEIERGIMRRCGAGASGPPGVPAGPVLAGSGLPDVFYDET